MEKLIVPAVKHAYLDLSLLHALPFPLDDATQQQLVQVATTLHNNQRFRFISRVLSKPNAWYVDQWPSPKVLIAWDRIRAVVYTLFYTEKQYLFEKLDQMLCDDLGTTTFSQTPVIERPLFLLKHALSFASVPLEAAEELHEFVCSISGLEPNIDDYVSKVWVWTGRLPGLDDSSDTDRVEVTGGASIGQTTMKKLEEIASGVRALSYDHAEVVNGQWEHMTPFTLPYVRKLISLFPSAGFWVKGELVSWSMLHSDLSFGLSYTLPEHRGKGYSQKCIAHLMLACVRDLKALPFSHVREGNAGSERVKVKLGFEVREEVKWVEGYPNMSV